MANCGWKWSLLLFGCTTVVATVDVLTASNNDVKMQNSKCMFRMTIKSSWHLREYNTFQKSMDSLLQVSILDSILDSCANPESSRGLSLTRQKTKDSPITDFSILLHRHITTRHGLFVWATVCFTYHKLCRLRSKQDQVKQCCFYDIWIKLHFPKYSFKCLLQMKTNSVYTCRSNKIN